MWGSGLFTGRQTNAPLVSLAGWLLPLLFEPLTTRFLEESADQDFSILGLCNGHAVYLEKITFLNFMIFMILPA